MQPENIKKVCGIYKIIVYFTNNTYSCNIV